MTGVIMAAVVVGLIGLLIGLLLGFAAKAFAVPVDEKEIEVREFLPGNNCGGCGYAGCDALAKAIAAGEAPVNACPVGGAAVAEKIGNVMGVAAGESVKMVAYVKCSGTCDKAGIKANYYGISDCKRAAAIPGRGDKACSFGCMGFGSCVAACKFDAIHVEHGVAIVDKEKCVNCGMCKKVCPILNKAKLNEFKSKAYLFQNSNEVWLRGSAENIHGVSVDHLNIDIDPKVDLVCIRKGALLCHYITYYINELNVFFKMYEKENFQNVCLNDERR